MFNFFANYFHIFLSNGMLTLSFTNFLICRDAYFVWLNAFVILYACKT